METNKNGKVTLFLYDYLIYMSIIIFLFEIFRQGWPDIFSWAWTFAGISLIVFMITYWHEIVEKVGTWPNVNYNESMGNKGKSLINKRIKS